MLYGGDGRVLTTTSNSSYPALAGANTKAADPQHTSWEDINVECIAQLNAPYEPHDVFSSPVSIISVYSNVVAAVQV